MTVNEPTSEPDAKPDEAEEVVLWADGEEVVTSTTRYNKHPETGHPNAVGIKLALSGGLRYLETLDKVFPKLREIIEGSGLPTSGGARFYLWVTTDPEGAPPSWQ